VQDQTRHKLHERVKELTALHRTARLLQDDSRPSGEVVREIVSLLPPAWQYPEIVGARIRSREFCESTPEFRSTPWTQSARFALGPQETGEIEVVYYEERPPENEGPFLAEERDLIESLADMLGSYFRRQIADREVQTAHDNLERLVLKRTEELRRTNERLATEVSDHLEARRQIEDYQNRLRQLATELTLADARERRQIAIDLHDHIIQEFAFIKMRIAQFRGDAIFCGFERNLEEIISLLEGAIHHTRELTFEISAPILYELGLPAALEWLGEQYGIRHKLAVKVAAPRTWIKIPEAVRVTLFRCVQELLTNIVKYAQTDHATITLSRKDHTVTVEVADQGIGFDPNKVERTGRPSGFGLFSIRERLKYFGGQMNVQSETGKGTTVSLTVQLEG
jgi:signal transduction histidine kinase